MISTEEFVAGEGMGYVYSIVAALEHHVPPNMENTVGAFVNLGVAEEEVLVGEEVPHVNKIYEREGHLNLINWVGNFIFLKNLLQKEAIDCDPEYEEGRAQHPPSVIGSLINIKTDHIV